MYEAMNSTLESVVGDSFKHQTVNREIGKSLYFTAIDIEQTELEITLLPTYFSNLSAIF